MTRVKGGRVELARPGGAMLVYAAQMGLAVVTGANRGIGLALALALARRGYEVLAAVRSASVELERSGILAVTGVDVARDEGIARLVAAVGERPLDLLVNNAGILAWGDRLGALDIAGIRAQFEVNALGPLRVTDALAPRLVRGAKVALISSRMGSITDNVSGASYGYRMSKAALNMAGRSLAIDLLPRRIAVTVLHPGMVSTDRVAFDDAAAEPGDGAEALVDRIDALTLETTGGFWHANGQLLPW